MEKLRTTGVVSDETKTSTGGYARLADARFIPTLFNTKMVMAILQLLKSQTRREIKPQPIIDTESGFVFFGKEMLDIHSWKTEILSLCKYQIGDTLWVRETWQQEAEFFEASSHSASWDCDWWEATGGYVYRADKTELPIESEAFGKWKSGIHMPKSACRIFLKVKNVCIEQLKDISEADAIAEGIESVDGGWKDYFYKGVGNCGLASTSYLTLWQSINKNFDIINDNPWVWVIDFEITNCPAGFR